MKVYITDDSLTRAPPPATKSTLVVSSDCSLILSIIALMISSVNYATLGLIMNCIIVHGKPGKTEYYSDEYPSPSNSHWIPWLQSQLIRKGIVTQTPEMLNAWQPDYAIWSKEISRHDLNPETILVGHSIGAGFLVQYLSEHPEVNIHHLCLVAPSFGDTYFPGTERYEDPLLNSFCDFTPDSKLMDRCQKMSLIYSTDDGERILKSVSHLKKIYSPSVYEYHDKGHFTRHDMKGSIAFPEIIPILTS